jgi:hypothetical protein
MATSIIYADLIENVQNCPKDIFVDKLLSIHKESFEVLCEVRACFYQEALKHSLPDDAPLVKRCRGEHTCSEVSTRLP